MYKAVFNYLFEFVFICYGFNSGERLSIACCRQILNF